jgi:hypothetical protein
MQAAFSAASRLRVTLRYVCCHGRSTVHTPVAPPQYPAVICQRHHSGRAVAHGLPRKTALDNVPHDHAPVNSGGRCEFASAAAAAAAHLKAVPRHLRPHPLTLPLQTPTGHSAPDIKRHKKSNSQNFQTPMLKPETPNPTCHHTSPPCSHHPSLPALSAAPRSL